MLNKLLTNRLLSSPPTEELKKNPVEGFSAGLVDDNDIYTWDILIIGPSDTVYEGGFFKAHLTFPKEYPLRPPKLKFLSEMWHPNSESSSVSSLCLSRYIVLIDTLSNCNSDSLSNHHPFLLSNRHLNLPADSSLVNHLNRHSR